ncbi:hypothetical protein E2320_010013 [Naja naja]|nr:hypothetical protein E2320_010013 [Naja naja]
MEGFPGLKLLLMLTGLFASCTSYLFLRPSTASLQNTGKSPKEVVLTQGTSLRIKAFCAYQYLQGQPVWYKEKQQNELGWQYMTPKANQKIMLEDHFLPNKAAPPPRIRMPLTSTISGMKMQEVIKIQGESLIVKAFCSQQHVQAEIVWCKEELPKECSLEKLISFSRSRWKRLTTQPDQRVIMNDLGNGCIYVFMSALQSEDTGIYWFGVLDGPNIIPLRKIRVIVQKDQQKEDIGTTTSEDEQRVYQVVWILVFTTIGITILPAFILVVMVLTKRKRRVADDLNFDDNPNCRVINFQILESNTAQSLHEEINTIYSIVKLPRISTDANRTFPLRSNVYEHSHESIGGPSPSGSVEYASIF